MKEVVEPSRVELKKIPSDNGISKYMEKQKKFVRHIYECYKELEWAILYLDREIGRLEYEIDARKHNNSEEDNKGVNPDYVGYKIANLQDYVDKVRKIKSKISGTEEITEMIDKSLRGEDRDGEIILLDKHEKIAFLESDD